MTDARDDRIAGETADLDDGAGVGRIGRRIGLVAGPALALGLQVVGPPEGLTREAWITVSLLALMIVWWVSECVPVAATALVPLVGLPLAGVASAREAAAPFADPTIYLFVGGFMLAAAVERWNLHARAALAVASRAGGDPRLLIGGMIVSAGLISMWISNTATALILTPIAVGVAKAMARDGKGDPALAAGLVLGVAYAASIGGMGTPVGSPTNVIAVGYLDRQGLSVSFADWMALAAPIVAGLLLATWAILAWRVRGADAGARARARATLLDSYRALGPMTAPQARVLAVFALVALAWMFREALIGWPPLGNLTDMSIAIAGALALFLIPAGGGRRERLLDWRAAEKIPWGIVVLFGGGLSIAAAMDATGLSQWLAGQLAGLGVWPKIAVIAVTVVITVAITEAMSNVATLTAMLPVLGALAAATGINPLLLVFPACLAASLGYMMPIATAPNAIAYATGLAPMRTMLRAGLMLNCAGVVVIVAMMELFGAGALAR